MPEYGNEKADICLKDREQMSAFWMKWILVLYKCSQKSPGKTGDFFYF